MVRRLKKYASLIIMHNGHKSWSVGCVSEDRNGCEWVEGLDWAAMAALIDKELRPNVSIVPARLVHGGDIMDAHTKLGNPMSEPLTAEQGELVREALEESIEFFQQDTEDGKSAWVAEQLSEALVKILG